MLHPSRIFTLYLCLFLIMVAVFTFHPLDLSLIYLVPTLIVIIFLWRIKFIRYLFLIIFVIILASVRTFPFFENQNYSLYEIKNAKGIIITEPIIDKAKQKFIVSLPELSPNTESNLKITKIEITTNQSPKYKFGQIIVINGGKISKDYLNSYHKSKNVISTVSYPKISIVEKDTSIYTGLSEHLFGIKNFFKNKISSLMPEPQSGLINGVLLGERSSISDEIKSSLSRTGTTHIIALSGFNITIIATFLSYITSGLSRKISIFISIVGIFCFVFTTGFSASAIRAGIMGALLVGAKLFGRKSDGLVAIIFAGSVMVYANPLSLVYDIGFQLSFSAACGIVFLYPELQKIFSFFGKAFSENLSATLSAIIFTWPISSYYFGLFSVVALFTNLLILPFIELLMLTGFLIVPISYISNSLTEVFLYINWAISSYIFRVIDIFSSVPWATIPLKSGSIYFFIGYYIVIAELIIFLKIKQNGKTKNI